MRVVEFFRSETGAVTVDWVVLTAAIVGLGVATISAVSTGAGALGDGVETTLTNATVAQLDFGAEPEIDNYGGACGGTPQYPVMDCGVTWTFGIAGTIEVNGQSYFVNDQNVIVDENGNATPLMMSAWMDSFGNFHSDGPYDIAGRLVDNNGVPL